MDFFLVGTLPGLGPEVETKGSTQMQLVDFYARSALTPLNRIVHGTRWSEPFQIHLHEPPGRVPPPPPELEGSHSRGGSFLLYANYFS